MKLIGRRSAVRRVVLVGVVAMAGLNAPAWAQVGKGIGNVGGAGGDDNDKKNKKKKSTPTPRIPFVSDGEGRVRFDLNLTPVGEGASRVVLALAVYDEKAKRYVMAMELGTFDGALNRKTAPAALAKGKFALELYGAGFQYDIRVERGPAKSDKSDKPDDADYSVIARKSGKF